MESYRDDIISAIDRIVLLSWLLKDFGWMTTNVYLGWPFGASSFFFHLALLILDRRKSFIWYNLSFILWVTGNIIWMSIEFLAVNSSSQIHWGPYVPISNLSDDTIDLLNYIKICLFASSLSVQLIMYTCIYLGCIEMPRHFEEDTVSLNEVKRLVGGSVTELMVADMDRGGEINEQGAARREGISVAFVENTYVVFWVMKDLFWSCGTGDVRTSDEKLAIFLETIALFCGLLALSSYLITAYLCRRYKIAFLDSLTTLVWISANYIWMNGEFFIRYQDLTLDDTDQGNDGNTRIAASVFFSTGILIQVSILTHLSTEALRDMLDSGGTTGRSIQRLPRQRKQGSSVWNAIRFRRRPVESEPRQLSRLDAGGVSTDVPLPIIADTGGGSGGNGFSGDNPMIVEIDMRSYTPLDAVSPSAGAAATSTANDMTRRMKNAAYGAVNTDSFSSPLYLRGGMQSVAVSASTTASTGSKNAHRSTRRSFLSARRRSGSGLPRHEPLSSARDLDEEDVVVLF